MKKTTVLALSLLLLLLTACGQTAASASSDTPNQADVPPVQEEAGTPFDRFEASLDDAGYAYETVTMAAELVGARIGVKYKFFCILAKLLPVRTHNWLVGLIYAK